MSNEIKKPLAVVFGGNGFIGSHLCKHLNQNGYKVIIADLNIGSCSDYVYIKCDVRESIEIDLPESPELVFNLAAIHRTPGHAIEDYFETNVLGAINIAKWCEKNCVKKLMFTSSIAVYGPDCEAKTESSRPNPQHAYGKSKLISELVFQEWQSRLPDERTLVICRPAVIFGPGENGNFTRLARALKNRYFFYPGGKNTIKACGYITDLIKSFDFMFNASGAGQYLYNFCYPQKYTIEEICLAFCKIANYSKPISLPFSTVGKILKHMPHPVSFLGSRLIKLSNDTNVTPEVLVRMGFRFDTEIESAIKQWNESSLHVGLFK